MAKIFIIVGHTRTGTLCEALGEAYLRGAREAGHEAVLFTTAQMKFDPVLWEGFERVQPLEPDLQEAHNAMLAADHLVIIFPLWMGYMPAILAGLFQRILQPELAADAKRGVIKKPLKGKSARVIITMNMPAIIFRLWYGAHGLKLLKRNVLELVGVKPVRASLFGLAEAGGARRRARWLRAAEALGQRGA